MQLKIFCPPYDGKNQYEIILPLVVPLVGSQARNELQRRMYNYRSLPSACELQPITVSNITQLTNALQAPYKNTPLSASQ